MKLSVGVVLCIAATGLGGCLSTEETKAQAIQSAQQHCAAEGKQFVLGQTEVQDKFMYDQVMISGHCLGPGDPGYKPPSQPPATKST